MKHITLCYTYFTVSCKLWLEQVPERLRVPLELPCWASILLTWIAGLCSVPVRLLYCYCRISPSTRFTSQHLMHKDKTNIREKTSQQNRSNEFRC